MNALLPLVLTLVVGTATAEVPAPEGPTSSTHGETDLVEVHLGAGTPGVRLVVKPPASAGPDAEPYVVEVRVPPWPEATPTTPSLADEPIAHAPVMLATPATMASAVPTASYATQPIDAAPLPSETAFLRHAPADELAPPIPPAEPTVGTAVAAPAPAPAPAPKEVAPPPSWVSAAENFEQACDNGYAQACSALAEMVANGQAGPADMDRAHDLYQRGCDRGDDAACAAIAPVSTTPAPVAVPAATTLATSGPTLGEALGTAAAAPAVADAAPAVVHAPAPAPAAPAPEAAPTVEAAPAVADATPAFAVERNLFDDCQRGDNAACNELGERHTHGDAVSQDYDRAAKLFQRACAGGEMSACTNLGILYKVGEGVSRDALRAERLFALACNGGAGDDRACGLAEE